MGRVIPIKLPPQKRLAALDLLDTHEVVRARMLAVQRPHEIIGRPEASQPPTQGRARRRFSSHRAVALKLAPPRLILAPHARLRHRPESTTEVEALYA